MMELNNVLEIGCTMFDGTTKEVCCLNNDTGLVKDIDKVLLATITQERIETCLDDIDTYTIISTNAGEIVESTTDEYDDFVSLLELHLER